MAGAAVHLVGAHPTPPVLGAPADRNGRRNADEIRLISAILDGADWLVDDEGRAGGLSGDAAFVVAGDLNADPVDGDSRQAAIRALLSHPRIQDPAPASPGAAEAGMTEQADKAGAPERHTADWPTSRGRPGNLRVDYVLPSAGLTVLASGVFWPERRDPRHALVARRGRDLVSSDHRLVWVDIALP